MKNLLIFISVLFFISCNSKAKQATLYNNDLLKQEQYIADEMEVYLGKLKDSSQTDSLVGLQKELLTKIEESIQSVERIKDFNGNVVFKQSVVAVLKAYYDGVKFEYEKVADYQRLPLSEKSLEKKQQAENYAIQADEKIGEAEDYFILMQQQFAKENNFELDK